ncbi:MAG TPA: hypothetical protein VKC17_08730 [Sphingomicrobium sp.]|jgi:hypothetical protein|nr:hypothetical protein [Sphingomicrobium sp.]
MELRLPFFIAAGVCLLLALLVEAAAAQAFTGLFFNDKDTPGHAINALALIDGILLYSLIWMLLSVVAPRSVTGRAQGCVTLFVSFFGCLGTIALIVAAFVLLMLMLALLVAVPFGTIAYLVAWGHFARGAATTTLALAMLLKIAFLILLVIAHQRFLQNKGLLVLVGLSLGLTWLIGFVHALLPIFLVSIGDQLMALVICIIAAIWLALLLIGAIIASIKAILSLRKLA